MASSWQSDEWGQTAIFQMRNAPYPHESRSEGFTLNEKFFPRDPHYVDNSVALFIPVGYRTGEKVDLLYYFHGHSNNVQTSLEQYQLRQQVAASGKNVIMVFPEGPRDAQDSGGGKLEDPGGLRRLTEEVLQVLLRQGKIGSTRLGQVILCGHSGAYRVISYCLEQGGLEENISEVYLLDASYGRLEQFADWVRRNRKGVLRSIFTNHLADENVMLMTQLTRLGIPYRLLADQDATDRDLRNTRVLFLHTTTLDHNGTVQWLQRWLNASNLPRSGFGR